MTVATEAPHTTAPGPQHEKSFPAWVAVVVVALFVLVPLAVAVTREAPRLAATNSKVLGSGVALAIAGGEERCQGGELLPATGASIVLYVAVANDEPGPPLDIRFLDRQRRPVSTTRSPGGYRDGALRLPFTPPQEEETRAFACIRNGGDVPVLFAGNLTPFNPDAARGPNSPGARRTDEVRIDYYREGTAPIWRLLPDVARRFSHYKPRVFGPWSMWAVMAAVMALGVLSLWLLHKVMRKPAAQRVALRWATACFGVAFAQGALWSIVTPPLQVPDETVHYAFASYVRAHGTPPPRFLQRETRNFATPIDDASFHISRALPFNVEGRPTWSDVEEDRLRATVQPGDSVDPRAARKAASGAPLYYYVPALATKALVWVDGLDLLFAMRLASAAAAAFTAFFTALFLAEVFRRVDLGVVLGSLAVALHPVLGFLGGGVNNDNLLLPLSTLVFYLVARGFRRGMTPRLAALVGVALGLGYLTKQRMLFFVPVSVLAVAWLGWRARGAGLVRRVVPGAITGSTFLLFAVAWRFASTRLIETYGVARPVARASATSLRGAVSYVWQSFFPRLWFMQDDFLRWPQFVLWDVYVEGFVGRFGWFQYDFPSWVEAVGGLVLAALVVLAVIGVWRSRARLQGRWIELLTYAALLAGTAALMGVAAYRYRATHGYNLEQTRYLFPCIALYGGVVALAVRGVATRYRWAFAAGLATLFAGHVLASVLLTIHRYYV